MVTTRLHHWLKTKMAFPRRARGVRRKPVIGLRLETLEDRLAPAATLTWQGVPNLFDAANLFSDPNAWSAGRDPGPGDDLIFPDVAAVNHNIQDDLPAITLHSIRFEGSGYVISSFQSPTSKGINAGGITATKTTGTNFLQIGLTLVNSTPTPIDVAGSGELILDGVIKGVGGLSKSGSGELRIEPTSGDNTYTGTTMVNQGRLSIGKGSSLGATGAGNETVVAAGAGLSLGNDSSDVSVGNELLTLAGTGEGGVGALDSFAKANSWAGAITLGSDPTTVTVGHDSSLTLSGVVGGAGGLRKTGSGTLVLTAANTYAGATTVASGVLNIRNGGALGTTANGTQVQDGASLELQGSITVAGEALTLNGSGSSGEGALRIAGGINTWAGPVFLATTSTVSALFNIGVTLSGVVSGPAAAALEKTDNGFLTLSGSNTYAGPTRLNGGVLGIRNNAALGSGANGIRVAPGATLDVDGDGLSIAEPLTLNGTGLVAHGGALAAFGGTNTWTGSILLESTSVVEATNLNAAKTQLTLSGIVSGSSTAKLKKVGDGTVVLTNANTYAGPTEVSEGTLGIQNNLALGTTDGGTQLDDTTTLDLQGTGLVVAEPLTVHSAVLHTSSGTPSWTGTIGIESGGLAEVTTDSGSRLTLSGVISGPNSDGLRKSGLGELVLSGKNSYTDTNVDEGILTVERSSALGSGNVSINESTIQLRGGVNVGNLLTVYNPGDLRSVSGNNTWSGDIRLFSVNSPIVDVLSDELAFTGVIYENSSEDTAGLIKAGAGTLTLGGAKANTFTGSTTVNEGGLRLAKTNAVRAVGPLVVGNGALNGPTASVIVASSNAIDNAAQVTVNSNGQFNTTDISDTIGSLVIHGGSVSLGSGTSAHALTVASLDMTGGSIDMASQASLVLNGNVTATSDTAGNSATINGRVSLGGATRTFTVSDGPADSDMIITAVVSGAAGAGIVKAGSGTLELTNINSYTGDSTVTAGVLLVNGTQQDSRAVVNGGTLSGSGTVGGVSAPGETVNPGNPVGTLTSVGNVAFRSSSNFQVDLKNTGSDQLFVLGTASLGNATLKVVPQFTPTERQTFTILSNDGTDEVVGTFNGLAEGTRVTVPVGKLKQFYTISYHGGDGNDVVLTYDNTGTAAENLQVTPAHVNEGNTVTLTGNLTDPDPQDILRLVVDWCDGSAVTTIANIGRDPFAVSHTYQSAPPGQSSGPYTIHASWQDNHGDGNGRDLFVTVTNGPPVLGALTVLVPPFSGVATLSSITDLGPRDTFNALVDWGDGTTETFAYPAGTTTLRQSHLYGHDGTFPIHVTVTDEGGSATASALATVSPATATQRFVAQVYRDALGREVDPAGLRFWSGLLDQGASGAGVVRGIVNSPEYRTNQVQDLYRTLLHRPAESEGLAAWLRFLTVGGTLAQVRAEIAASPEYFQARGGESSAGFLDALYADALGRSVDPTGGAAFRVALAQEAPRQQVVEAVFNSDEYRASLVEGFYQRFLGRAADPTGLRAEVVALQRGASEEAALASFVASEEYLGRQGVTLSSHPRLAGVAALS